MRTDAHRKTGEVVPWLLGDVGARTRKAIEAEAARLHEWLGPACVSGSFPTPIEIELRH